MKDCEKRDFASMLKTHFAMHGLERGNNVLRRYWDNLTPYSLHDVSVALAKHEQDPIAGKYFAKPADLIAILEAARPGGWPDADAAWSLAGRAMDEDDSVVWTQEMATAWGEACPIMDRGDDVGARMAFKSIYGRAIAMAKAHGYQPKWIKSLGRDREGRRIAVEDAVNKGRLPPAALDGMQALPAPDLKLLEGGAKNSPESQREAAIEAIKGLRAAISSD